MKFIKKHWHVLIVSLMTVGLGVLVLVTSRQISQTKPVAPTAPQAKPKAATGACTLAFAIGAPTTTSPTPSTTSTPSPTATPTPTPTPTPQPNTLPECTGLSVSPSSGSAPLTVSFFCSGIDRDGDITAVDVNFGDGKNKVVEKNVGSPGSLLTSYTYPASGSFSASCRVRDNNYVYSGTPDACKKTVTVNGGGGTGTTTTTTTTTGGEQAATTPIPTEPPTPKVPVAGAGPSVLGITTIVGGAILLLLGLAL